MYENGMLEKKTKDIRGFVASMVLRCYDCIKCHSGNCFELGLYRDEVHEIFAVANIVGV